MGLRRKSQSRPQGVISQTLRHNFAAERSEPLARARVPNRHSRISTRNCPMRALHLAVFGAVLALPSVGYSQADGPVGGKVGPGLEFVLDGATRFFPWRAAIWVSPPRAAAGTRRLLRRRIARPSRAAKYARDASMGWIGHRFRQRSPRRRRSKLRPHHAGAQLANPGAPSPRPPVRWGVAQSRPRKAGSVAQAPRCRGDVFCSPDCDKLRRRLSDILSQACYR